ncbi:unnamed protein product, partial [Mesorhabditis spiculigera]
MAALIGHPASSSKMPQMTIASCVPLAPSLKKPTHLHPAVIFGGEKPRKSVEFSLPSSPVSPGMVTGSRFKIVPVETKYKRGRWTCHDFYDPELKMSSRSCPPPPVKCPDIVVDTRAQPKTAPPAQATRKFSFEQHEQENNGGFSKSQTQYTRPVAPRKQPIAGPLNNAQRAILLRSTSYDKDGKYTPSEVLQSGLENTLDLTNGKKMSTSSANATASTPPMVAIDSKIEQAMDLVKTHLMFAVREEVEVLRARIVDLEAHLHYIESENNVLRKYVPDDILKRVENR